MMSFLGHLGWLWQDALIGFVCFVLPALLVGWLYSASRDNKPPTSPSAERDEALDRLDTFVAALEHVLTGQDDGYTARKLLDNYYEALERKQQPPRIFRCYRGHEITDVDIRDSHGRILPCGCPVGSPTGRRAEGLPHSP